MNHNKIFPCTPPIQTMRRELSNNTLATTLLLATTMGGPNFALLSSPKEDLFAEAEDIGNLGWDVADNELSLDLMGWDESRPDDQAVKGADHETKIEAEHEAKGGNVVDFWEVNNGFSLNLSLNYQEVMDAWSDRGSILWTEEFCSIVNDNANANASRRGTSNGGRGERKKESSSTEIQGEEEKQAVLKEIRYQVRKLNAERRPRIKGCFVKSGPGS